MTVRSPDGGSPPAGRRGVVRKATKTSDVIRPRLVALVGLGAALGLGVALALARPPLGAERAVPRPHAKVACAGCHEAPASSATSSLASTSPAPSQSAASAPRPFEVTAACKTCHGAGHGSVRPGHRALAARGELACADCHRQHAGGQGVTFTGDDAIRWGAGVEAAVGHAPPLPKGTTVPLVALAACARCHDVTRAGDPIAACVAPDVRSGKITDLRVVVATCFDEHRRPNDASPAGDLACAKQHGETRFAAWDAAREVARTTPWVAPARREGNPWLPLAGAFAGALALGVSAAAFERRRRKVVPRPSMPIGAAKKRLPVIDASRCLGCYACVDVCPFDVLTVEKYVAVVARPEECCGVVTCEQVCPNGSLRVDDGAALPDRPATDDHLESRDVPGLFLAGDLTGMPLIKNAINQGVRVVDRIAETLARARQDGETVDLVIVGAGPAGLSAALRAKEKGLSCVVLEQASIAASIRSFPRDKIVHDPPLELPIEGELWLREATKEEILAQWTRIVRARELDVREGARVVDVARAGDTFVVTASPAAALDGAAPSLRIRSRRLVVATGRRGTPRPLDARIEPAMASRVFYALADARSFAGRKVLVVGLGDAAMEAAVALARQPETTVTISYRGASFQRGKARNIAEVQALVAEGKLRLLFETVPLEVTAARGVVLGKPNGQRKSVAVDDVLVLIGGVPSWDLLTRAGLVRPRM